MAISDARFGGAVMLTTGRQLTFDSIECLAGYLAAGTDPARIATVHVSDFDTQRLIDASTAVYMRGGSVRSPMGRELAAFAAGADTVALRARYAGEVMSWSDVQRIAAAPTARPANPDSATPH